MSGTPLWLDLEPQYIDKNFKKVIGYLSAESKKVEHDSFYSETVSLLAKRSAEIMANLSSEQLYAYDDRSEAEIKKELMFSIQLLSAQLLVEGVTGDFAVSVFSKLVMCLALVNSSRADELAELLVKVVSTGDVPKGWITWNDLKDTYPLEIVIHKMLSAIGPKGCLQSSYEGAGTIYTEDDALFLGPMNDHDIHAKDYPTSISVLDNRIHLLTRKEDKLKQSDKDKIASISMFLKAFTSSQKAVLPHMKSRYSVDDEMEVEYIGTDKAGHMKVRTISEQKETIEGIVSLEMKSLFLYFESDFIKYIPVGSVFTAKYIGDNKFSIKKSFREHLIQNKFTDVGCTLPAKLMFIGASYSWLSEDGYQILTKPDSYYSQGDSAILKITSIGTGKYEGVVYGEIEHLATDEDIDNGVVKTSLPLDEEDIKRYGLEGFFHEKDDSGYLGGGGYLNPETIHSLYTTLYRCQPFCAKASERYNLLGVCRSLATLLRREEDADYLDMMCDYLESVTAFANARTKDEYEAVPKLEPNSDFAMLESVGKRVLVIDLLRGYGNPQSQEFISKVIEENDDETLTKIARLVQSCGNLQGVINKSMEGVIKREILQCLTVGQDINPNYEEEGGISIGVEGSTIEFKTSFFEAPADALEQNQEITIFNTICGFLNSELGGCLYLGVNDYGYVVGLDSDLQSLESRGLKAYHGIDGYMRYIQDRAREYFEQSVIACLTIDSSYGEKVVEIKVKPYTYDIVTVRDTAYIRVNASTQKMTDGYRNRIIKERETKKGTESDAHAALESAIASKTMVMLCRYSSSSSQSSKDREVEPFAFTADNSSVWAYESASEMNKVFLISRIGEVKLMKKKWQFESRHEKLEEDVFRMTGPTPTHIRLSMKRRAYNCLIEEYPMAKSHVYDLKAGETWVLDTDVYSMEGVARFVVGLASDIEILEGEELKNYLRDYAETSLKALIG